MAIFPILNDEQMSNRVGVKHLPVTTRLRHCVFFFRLFSFGAVSNFDAPSQNMFLILFTSKALLRFIKNALCRIAHEFLPE